MIKRRTETNERDADEKNDPTEFFERREQNNRFRCEKKIKTGKTNDEKRNI